MSALDFIKKYPIYYSCLLACDWSEEDLSRLKDIRKKYSKIAQAQDEPKENKKSANRFVRASTLLLDYFYGVGTFSDSAKPYLFPKRAYRRIICMSILLRPV